MTDGVGTGVGLSILGIIFIAVAYYVPIGIGFQLLIGVVGAIFLIVGVLSLFGIDVGRS